MPLFQGPGARLSLPSGDCAWISLHGAQVLSWVSGSREQLYLSPQSRYGPGSAIRGGVPVCFPQFNQRGHLPKHGFARTQAWSLVDQRATATQAQATLRLLPDATTAAMWPHPFEAGLTVTLTPGALSVALAVNNTGPSPLAFGGALHTYLAVDDAAHCTLAGLQGQPEWDALLDCQGTAAAQLAFDGAFDRVYAAPGRPLTLREPGRQLTIEQSDSWADTVVWNPGEVLCAQLPDMPKQGYRHMLCVEAAQVHHPIVVNPGATWRGWQRLSVV